MHNAKKQTIQKRMQKTADHLRLNKMEAYVVETKREALQKLEELLHEGDVIGVGGSATLDEIGAIDLIRKKKYNFLDRYAQDITPEEKQELFVKTFAADAFITSSNAITEMGELYNVDGTGNRVAPMIFGPKSVIVIAGSNKIVADLDAAARRVKELVAPANATRLGCNTYCQKTGFCASLREDLHEQGMCTGCHTPDRICCTYVTMAQQRIAGRIKVILVEEELGF